MSSITESPFNESSFDVRHVDELRSMNASAVPVHLKIQQQVANDKTLDGSTRATALSVVTSELATGIILTGWTLEINEESRALIAKGNKRDLAVAREAAPGMMKAGARMFAVGAVALTVAILAFSGVFGHLSDVGSVGIGMGAGLSGFVMFVGGALMAVSLKDLPIEKARK